MIADYYAEIKIAIIQSVLERQRDEWRYGRKIADESRQKLRVLTLEFHDADTDTDILARKSVSVL